MDAATITNSTVPIARRLERVGIGHVQRRHALHGNADAVALLADSTTYTVVVLGGTGSTVVKDAAGNALAADFNSTFTTSNGGPPTANAGTTKHQTKGLVLFTGLPGNGTGTLTYHWDFGDGGTPRHANPKPHLCRQRFLHGHADGHRFAQPHRVGRGDGDVNNVAPTATLSNNGPVNIGANVTISFLNQNAT